MENKTSLAEGSIHKRSSSYIKPVNALARCFINLSEVFTEGDNSDIDNIAAILYSHSILKKLCNSRGI